VVVGDLMPLESTVKPEPGPEFEIAVAIEEFEVVAATEELG